VERRCVHRADRAWCPGTRRGDRDGRDRAAPNGILQQLIQPIAYGAALGIHPLAVLIVTIAGGALFGTIGLVLAAPLTAAAVKIAEDLARARAQTGERATPEPGLGGVADAPSG